MKKQFLQAGEIVNTHGIRGEVRIVPWCDGPDFLLDIEKFYIDGKPLAFSDKRIHKNSLIAKPVGVDNVNDAALLKGKVISVNRDDVTLKEGRHFIADLLGLDAVDIESGLVFGKVTDVLNLPGNDVYVVKGEHEYMIPAVSAFLQHIDIDGGVITFRLIEGMRTNEN